MADFDPRDTVDIPDDRELDDNIPEAVCDVQTPVSAPDWLEAMIDLRSRLVAANDSLLDSRDERRRSSRGSNAERDTVARLDGKADGVRLAMSYLDEYLRDPPRLPPPNPEDALTIDECEAAGVDGTLRDM